MAFSIKEFILILVSGFRLAKIAYLENNLIHFPKIRDEINDFLKQENISLDKKYFSRINSYTLPGLVTAGWLSSLHSHRLSHREIRAVLYLSVCAPFYDDLADELHYSAAELEQVGILKSIARGHPFEKIFLHFFSMLCTVLPANSDFPRFSSLLTDAQARDAGLKGMIPDREKLRSTTFNRGGYALLLFRACIDKPFLEGEEKAVYLIGALLQVTEDLFDIYFDTQDKIFTLANSTADISEMKKEYDLLLAETVDEIDRVAFQKEGRIDFLRQLKLVVARSEICFDQLLKLQERSGGVFVPVNHSRKELICDMEKPANLLSSFVIAARMKF